MIPRMLKGLALAALFITCAMFTAVALSQGFGIASDIVWFMWGSAYADVCRRFKL